MKILVAVDGSSFTQHILDYLAAHKEWLTAAHHYTLLHVVGSVPPAAAARLDRETLHDYYAEEGAKVLDPLREFFRQQGVEANFVNKVGSVADLIAREAAEGNYDLLMMGSHGHGTLGGLLMGSVSTRTLSKCKTPVLLIR